MTIKEIVSELCKREKGKSNVKVGDMKEIISHLSDMIFEFGPEVARAIYLNGVRREKKKAKKK